MEELNYPELPEGYVWKKRGTPKGMEDGDEGDIDIWQDTSARLDGELVAWVSKRGEENAEIKARNRNTRTGKHGKPTPVSSYQEGINLIHAQLMLGLIGVGKCLEEE